MDPTQIERRFRHHPPSGPADIAAHEDIRARFRELAHHVNDAIPDGPDKDRVIDHLDDGLTSANAALARHRWDTTKADPDED